MAEFTVNRSRVVFQIQRPLENTRQMVHHYTSLANNLQIFCRDPKSTSALARSPERGYSLSLSSGEA